jgi:hypothetical protein
MNPEIQSLLQEEKTSVEKSVEDYIKALPRGPNNTNVTCIICKDDIENDEEMGDERRDRQIPCNERCSNSVYHEECIKKWILKDVYNNASCPHCRKLLHIPIFIENNRNRNFPFSKSEIIEKYKKWISRYCIYQSISYISINITSLILLNKQEPSGNIFFLFIFLFCIVATFSTKSLSDTTFMRIGERIKTNTIIYIELTNVFEIIFIMVFSEYYTKNDNFTLFFFFNTMIVSFIGILFESYMFLSVFFCKNNEKILYVTNLNTDSGLDTEPLSINL